MIDVEIFARIWDRLEQRHGKHEGAAAYLDFLIAQGLTEREVFRAAEALWATSRWFPRPADFLMVRAGAAWRAVLVLSHAPRFRTTAEHQQARDSVGERGWAALQELGGLDTVRNARDVVAVRKEFLAAYEAGVAEDAAQKALPPTRGPDLTRSLVRVK